MSDVSDEDATMMSRVSGVSTRMSRGYYEDATRKLLSWNVSLKHHLKRCIVEYVYSQRACSKKSTEKMYKFRLTLRHHSCALLRECSVFEGSYSVQEQQEAFEKCWAHSPLRAAARRPF